MIDITDYMIKKAKQIKSLNNRVYRAYPQLMENMRPFMVINPAGRQVLISDNEGQEVETQLTFTISIFDMSPEDVDNRFSELTNIYNQAHIQNTGYTPSYQIMNGMFTAQATYSANVDKRGFIYAR